jgi:XTP/dITP diphosphohydrolase
MSQARSQPAGQPAGQPPGQPAGQPPGQPRPPRLVFATRNRGKVVELRALLADLGIDVLSLDDLTVPVPDVVEDGDTFAANAAKKALAVSRATGLPALADDSGLEVDALGGAPGVRSARYAGEGAGDAANNARLLDALAGVPPERRTARFRSCLALADTAGSLGERVLTAEGACEGRILDRPRGTGGFGYDPLFYVPELDATFAELGVGTKNDHSHRARAMQTMRPRILAYFHLAAPGHSG